MVGRKQSWINALNGFWTRDFKNCEWILEKHAYSQRAKGHNCTPQTKKNISKTILSTLSLFSVQNWRTRKVDKVYNIADKVVCEKIDCIASTGNQ